METMLHEFDEDIVVDMVKVLLDGNPDITIRNRRGKTALDIAIEKGYRKVENILKKHKVKN